jgi:hypothetical protein
MSLETIYRVVSHAHKSAAEASGGTNEEKGAVDVLGGLSALLEARIQLHKQAVTMPSSTPSISALKPKLPTAPSAPKAAAAAAATPSPDPRKQRAAGDPADSYELK